MISGRTVVDGRFELLEPLGSGGMGTVWRAYDLALHREVALKEVRAEADDAGSSPGVHRERVLREARALARIGHPNVVAIHHIVDSPEVAHPWIVMELVRGQSLADHLARGPMPPAQVAHLGRGILAALRAAHQVGVLHRDIKPANVLLREDGSPVLTDFGIAAINGMNGLTSTGSVVGSLDYVAPERLSGQEGHTASDLWSLGLLLYVAVEGFHPLRRESTVATLAAVIRGEVPPPQRAGVLTAVLTALLVPDPNHRATAEQLDRMLAQAVGAGGFGGAPGVFDAPGAGNTPGAFNTPNAAITPGSVGKPHRSSGTASGSTPPPQLYGSTNPPARKPLSRGVGIGLAAAAVIAAVVATIAIVALRPDSADNRATASNPPTTNEFPATSRSASPTSGAPVNGKPVDLLTPTGIRQAITALEKVSGSEEFNEATFYPTYANVGAPVKTKPTLFDLFVYRDGTATRKGAGGPLANKPTVKLSSINWDILPDLLRTADESLGIPAPTLRYVIVDPSWTFNNEQPTVMVYLTDDYGGAYLAANTDGTVVTMYPRGR
ncbi:protein kinase domain-containing protein [Nocardia nepalensis]|uniref:serine/threonine-protein kinase n=1 Tax=Nocardia nepalensis TaxID=3375448 RepID=UPI003B67928D